MKMKKLELKRGLMATRIKELSSRSKVVVQLLVRSLKKGIIRTLIQTLKLQGEARRERPHWRLYHFKESSRGIPTQR